MIFTCLSCCKGQPCSEETQITVVQTHSVLDARHQLECVDNVSPDGDTETIGSLIEEECENQKERLQKTVKAFAKQIVVGIECEVIDSSYSAPRSAVCSMDRYMCLFRLQLSEADAKEIEVASIRDIVRDPQMTVGCVETHALAEQWAVKEFRPRFVCVRYGSQTDTQELVLLMPNAYERDRFFTCMKTLLLAMKNWQDQEVERDGAKEPSGKMEQQDSCDVHQ
eukprot:gnl/MRDRNA2_/MRDRNA2_201398_c0_seq1.p1 gnl/MRDRNA2_/MRDRNA2_201398_c0~~gnl/MRDRNA2_/MRDRNA2_201398_c0_seq1.p1  ORF type:complete len:224 (+),score=35.86 gnl/MRDRNA2_/MRDRNA2_201398_c0_seq1:68-739(+)